MNLLYVNLAAKPRLPFDWFSIKEQTDGGKILFDPKDIKLVTKLGSGEEKIEGKTLLRRLKADKSLYLYNANMLDFLEDNQFEPLVTEFLRPYSQIEIISFGTICVGIKRELKFVKILEQTDGLWKADHTFLDRKFDKNMLVLAKKITT